MNSVVSTLKSKAEKILFSWPFLVFWAGGTFFRALKLLKQDDPVLDRSFSMQQGELSLILILPVILCYGVSRNRFPKFTLAYLLSIFAMLALLFNPFGLLAGTMIALGSYGLGRWISRARTEFFGSVAVGLACFSGVIGWCVHTSFNFPMVYGVFTLLPALVMVLKSSEREHLKNYFLKWGSHWNPGEAFLLAILAVVVLPTWVNSFRPEIGYDALVHHYFAIFQIFHHGYYDFNPYVEMVTYYSHGVNWLMLQGMMLSGSEMGARFMVMAFSLISLGVVYDFGKSIRKKEVALLAMLLFAGVPVFECISSQGYIDSGTLLFFTASFFFMVRAFLLEDPLFMNFALWVSFAALTAKHSSLIWLFPIWFGALVLTKTRLMLWRERKTFLMWMGAGVVLFLIPHYGIPWWKTGNPFFPYFNQIFHSKLYDLGEIRDNLYVHPLTWKVIYDLTFHSHEYLEGMDGSIGISLFLSFPVFIYAFFTRRNLWIYFLPMIFFFLVTYKYAAYIRYLYPAFLPVFFGLSLYLSGEGKGKRFWIAALLLTIPINLAVRCTSNWVNDYPLGRDVLWGNNRNYLHAIHPEREMNDYISDKYDWNCKLFSMADPTLSMIKCDVSANLWLFTPVAIELLKAKTSEEAYQFFKSRGYTLILRKPPVTQYPWFDEFKERYLALERENSAVLLYKIK